MDSSSSSPAILTNVVEGENDRAILLTSSRGYPVSRAELHAYFTRRYGDIIEAIHMGVRRRDGDQSLYAMMVLHSAAKVHEIVNDGVFSTKFTINGKHVWARKSKS